LGRIVAFDYGKKRTGVAATDPLKIIANGVDTIQTDLIFKFITNYLVHEEVELFVVGMPTRMNGEDTHSTPLVRKFIQHLQKKYPTIPVEEEDEAFTSKMAVSAMIEGGMKKKDRRKKENIVRISATLILQSYLQRL
jgi:putative Holliday junction resolvase